MSFASPLHFTSGGRKTECCSTFSEKESRKTPRFPMFSAKGSRTPPCFSMFSDKGICKTRAGRARRQGDLSLGPLTFSRTSSNCRTVGGAGGNPYVLGGGYLCPTPNNVGGYILQYVCTWRPLLCIFIFWHFLQCWVPAHTHPFPVLGNSP